MFQCLKDCALCTETHAVHEELQPLEGLRLEKFVGCCLLCMRPCAGAREECDGSFSEKGAIETMCGELTAAHIPSLLAPLWEGGRENEGKVKPGKKGGIGGRCLMI